MTTEERTQELVTRQLGQLLLVNLRLQAEMEAMAAAVERRESPNGAQGADGSGTKAVNPHG